MTILASNDSSRRLCKLAGISYNKKGPNNQLTGIKMAFYKYQGQDI